jgi:hypothetical protein
MGELRLPQSIDDDRNRRLYQIFAERLDALPLERILVGRVDGVPASVVPWLLWQYSLERLGFLSETSARALVKRGLELLRYRGTPWALIEATKALGYATAAIDENLLLKRNSEILRNGLYWHGYDNHWARFRLLIDGAAVTTAKVQELWDVMQFFRPMRSHGQVGLGSGTQVVAIHRSRP